MRVSFPLALPPPSVAHFLSVILSGSLGSPATPEGAMHGDAPRGSLTTGLHQPSGRAGPPAATFTLPASVPSPPAHCGLLPFPPLAPRVQAACTSPVSAAPRPWPSWSRSDTASCCCTPGKRGNRNGERSLLQRWMGLQECPTPLLRAPRGHLCPSPSPPPTYRLPWRGAVGGKILDWAFFSCQAG